MSAAVQFPNEVTKPFPKLILYSKELTAYKNGTPRVMSVVEVDWKRIHCDLTWLEGSIRLMMVMSIGSIGSLGNFEGVHAFHRLGIEKKNIKLLLHYLSSCLKSFP